jgi:hypothetical protein
MAAAGASAPESAIAGTSRNESPTFSLTLFEKMPLQQAFSANHPSSDDVAIGNQLNLFSF